MIRCLGRLGDLISGSVYYHWHIMLEIIGKILAAMGKDHCSRAHSAWLVLARVLLWLSLNQRLT